MKDLIKCQKSALQLLNHRRWKKLSHFMQAALDIKLLKSLVNIEWGIFSQDFELSSRILNLEKNIFLDFETLHNFCHPLLFMFWIDIICHDLVQCGIKITRSLSFTYNSCHLCRKVSFSPSHRKGKLILNRQIVFFILREDTWSYLLRWIRDYSCWNVKK